MKRCPECRRDYYDDSLHYCLDDGAALLEGPASADDPATAVLSEPGAPVTGFQPESEGTTRVFDQPSARDGIRKRNLILSIGLGVAVAASLSLGAYLYYNRGSSKQIDSIAVMPFVNASGNPDIEYLSDGMTETLISSLSQLPKLNVKAPSSVFRYKGKDTAAQVIARELNVQAILNGRLVQRGDELTLYLSLVDGMTENQIWGKQYSRKLAHLIALQTEVAQDVSDNLRTRLPDADDQNLARKYTQNAEAYHLYLKGRFYWNKRTSENISRSIEYFNQAITLEPNFALAYSGLADAYVMYFDPGRDWSYEKTVKAREAATKALSLDDRLAEAHASLGLSLFCDYDFMGAERELKRAIELNPNYASAHQWYGNFLGYLGRHDEAIAEHRRAVELEPLSLPINATYGGGLFFARRYDESIAQYKKVLELDPNYAPVYLSLGSSYMGKGDHASAVDNWAKNVEMTGRPELAARMRADFASGGWHGYLRAVVEDRSRIASPYILSWAYTELGDKDKAFDELNRSYKIREPLLIRLKSEPLLDGLRNDPRYFEMLRKIGLPE